MAKEAFTVAFNLQAAGASPEPGWAEGAFNVKGKTKHKGAGQGGKAKPAELTSGVADCMLVNIEAESAEEAVLAIRREYPAARSGSCLAGKALEEVT